MDILYGPVLHTHHARPAAICARTPCSVAGSARQPRLIHHLVMVHLVDAIEALAFIATTTRCIIVVIIIAPQVSHRLDPVGRSFLLNFLDEFAELFNTSNIVKLFKFALNIP